MATISELFDLAVRYHQSGNLQEAEAYWERCQVAVSVLQGPCGPGWPVSGKQKLDALASVKLSDRLFQAARSKAAAQGFTVQDNLRLACGLVKAILRNSFRERHFAARFRGFG
jgi:hypothetical protein